MNESLQVGKVPLHCGKEVCSEYGVSKRNVFAPPGGSRIVPSGTGGASLLGCMSLFFYPCFAIFNPVGLNSNAFTLRVELLHMFAGPLKRGLCEEVLQGRDGRSDSSTVHRREEWVKDAAEKRRWCILSGSKCARGSEVKRSGLCVVLTLKRKITRPEVSGQSGTFWPFFCFFFLLHDCCCGLGKLKSVMREEFVCVQLWSFMRRRV